MFDFKLVGMYQLFPNWQHWICKTHEFSKKGYGIPFYFRKLRRKDFTTCVKSLVSKNPAGSKGEKKDISFELCCHTKSFWLLSCDGVKFLTPSPASMLIFG